MAREVTLDELSLLRTAGDWSHLRLAIHVPKVIYSARVNGIPASNDMINQINFDGATGTLADIHIGMTLYVGSSAGARDLGEVRLRKAPTSSRFYFGETSSIVWADNAYLTVVDHFPIRERVVRVTSGATYMDSDVAFTDQHVDFDPVPVLGPHIVVELVDADVDVTLGPPADTPSWVFDSTIASVLWVMPDATAIDDDTAVNPVATFASVGWHVCYCTVIAANGKSFEGVRYVYIWDLENQPARAFKITEDPSATYDDGGWSFAVDMYDEAHLGEVRDGALVILFAEDWYGTTKQSLGPVLRRENIICIGWVAGESIEWDPETGGRVQFVVQGPHYWMKKLVKYALEIFMATNTPDSWSVMPALTVARAVWHLLHWRFNITQIMDVMLTDDARMAPFFKANSSSLWSQINEIAWKKIFARPGCDRYARFWLEIDPQMVPEADRDFPVVQTLTKKDWEGRIEFDRKKETELCILFSSGEQVDESGNAVVLYGMAPGHAPLPYGDPEIVDGTLVSDQAQCNEQTGLYMGWKNNPYPDVPIDMPQNNRMIDLWPRQHLAISIAETDTERGIVESMNLVPRSITLRVDGEAGTLSTSLGCEAETFAETAIDGDVPPPDSGLDIIDMSIPPFDLSDLEVPDPIYDYPDPTDLNENHPKEVVIASSNFGIIGIKNFDADSDKLKWEMMNAGLDSVDRTEVQNLLVTPSGSIWITTYNLEAGACKKIYWASGLGGKWNLYYDADDHDDHWVTGIGYDHTSSERICFVTAKYATPGTGTINIGNRNGYTAGDDDLTITYNRTSGIAYLNGHWFVIASLDTLGTAVCVFKFSYSGSLVNLNFDFYGDGSLFTPYARLYPYYASDSFCAMSKAGKVIAWIGGVGAAEVHSYFTINPDGVTWTISTEGVKGNPHGLAISPTGTHMMSSEGFTPAIKISPDSGASWSYPGAIPAGSDVVDDCGDDNRFLFGGGINMNLTIDHGTTYVNKIGNLLYIAPLIDITHIRFIK